MASSKSSAATAVKRKATAMRSRTVLSRAELGACAALVAYFIFVLYSEGTRFSGRLVSAGVAVPGLQPWLRPLGGQVDLSDYQWREFRASMPLLSAVMAGFVASSRAVQAAAPQHRVALYLCFALVFLAVLHGACLLYVLGLSLAGYYLARATARQPYGLLVVWAWHCGTFLLVRAYEGVPFALFGPQAAVLDQHRGMLRWHIHYNLLLLRMLSFAADYRWQLQQKPGRTREPPATPPAPDQDLRTRSELWQDPAAYSNLRLYLAYLLYPPLYIAGPISTFNAFASQMAAPAASVTVRSTGLYLLRALGCWACMEWLSHNLWFTAVVRHKLWVPLAAAEGRPLSPLDMCLIPWWVMIIFWLKFLVIWRFFRFWALADGVDVPENMTRCICNNYDLVGFWKNWHASYNQWLVRYMYIPLGGATWRALNVWLIFTFVAVWHDLELRLLGWAWLMALLFTPELGVKWLGQQGWCIPNKGGRLFCYAAGVAAALNIVLLIAANMVGFVLGLDGVQTFVQQVLGQPRFLPLVLLACFCGAQLMFVLRDVEAAKADRQQILLSKQ